MILVIKKQMMLEIKVPNVVLDIEEIKDHIQSSLIYGLNKWMQVKCWSMQIKERNLLTGYYVWAHKTYI